MNEKELQRAVIDLARYHGILFHHCRDSRYCDGKKGLPDLILIGPGGLIMPELKTDNGQTSAEQDLWIWVLTRHGISAPIWRPKDLTNGVITAALAAIARKAAA